MLTGAKNIYSLINPQSRSHNQTTASSATRKLPRPIFSIAGLALVGLIVLTLGVRFVGTGNSAQAAALPWLSTNGNLIVDDQGQTVMLRGVNLEQREWQWGSNPSINFELNAIPVIAGDPATGNWGGNIILIAIASGPVNRGDALYLSHLDQITAAAKAEGAYTLMVYRYDEPNGAQPTMPDPAAEDAMAALALRYAAEPAVLYGLQVEPSGVTWAELTPRLTTMIDAIRANNAQSLIFVPGTQFGRYIHFAITDPIVRPNLVYKTHPYDSWATIQNEYQLDALSAIYPVFIGEFGTGSFSTQADVDSLMAWADTNAISWTAWVFNQAGPPTLLVPDVGNTTFEPSAYGITVRDNMQAWALSQGGTPATVTPTSLPATATPTAAPTQVPNTALVTSPSSFVAAGATGSVRTQFPRRVASSETRRGAANVVPALPV